MNARALPARLELTPNEPVGTQPALFGPETPLFSPSARKLGGEIKDFREHVLKLTLLRAAELLGVGARELFEAEQGAFSFDIETAKALLQRGAR